MTNLIQPQLSCFIMYYQSFSIQSNTLVDCIVKYILEILLPSIFCNLILFLRKQRNLVNIVVVCTRYNMLSLVLLVMESGKCDFFFSGSDFLYNWQVHTPLLKRPRACVLHSILTYILHDFFLHLDRNYDTSLPYSDPIHS